MTTTRGGSPWADLPEEILDAIGSGSGIDRPIDVLTFRSVCNSWRSAVPTPDFDQLIPQVEVRLPYPDDIDGVLVPSTMCCVEFQPQIPNDDSTFSAGDAPPPLPQADGGWLIKIEESSRGKLQLLNPISNLKLRYSPIQLSLLDFRPVQLSTSFRLRYQIGFPTFEINKVLLYPPSASATSSPPEQSTVTVIAIFHEGRIGCWRKGDQCWTLLDGKNFDYDDLILHRGRYLVIDRLGKVSLIDSSLRFDESYSSPQFLHDGSGGGGQKNLVESGGDLYLIDRYLDGRRRNWKDVEDAITNSFNPIRYLVGTGRCRNWNPRAVDFKVYKLDEEMREWVEVKSLGDDDTVFVLTTECCFSAPAAQIAGGKKDCIYYSDDDDYCARTMLTTDGIRVFQLWDGSLQEVKSLPSESNIFLPPGFTVEF